MNTPEKKFNSYCPGLVPSLLRLPWEDSVERVSTNPLQVYREDGEFLGIGQVVNLGDGLLLIPQVVF